ncbi:MAG TPA: SET domain-containing protein-lysine N-methyltransferase [Chitinophagaceae bacterium]|nr:SET domain-containing protein-lysine N-methyltransferase [Chitinophagaceae bacterium]
MVTPAPPAYRLISGHGFAEVRQHLHNQQQALYILQPFQAGETIAAFSAGTISAEPTYLTVQVGNAKHITLQPEFLQYINHSCAPNVFFNTTTMELTALRDIAAGEELTFFYPSTEWEMTQAFQCYCGHANCIGEIKGAKFLAAEQLKGYLLTDFIMQQLAENAGRKVA